MSFILVFLNLLLRVAITIVIILAIFWLIGVMYPYVADALGVPYHTAYDVVTRAFAGIRGMLSDLVDYVRAL